MTRRTQPHTSEVASYAYPIGIGEAIGVELEYMIVDRETLDVRPIADEILRAVSGSYESDAEPEGPGGVIGYCNELVLHVIELKTLEPVATLTGLAERFQKHVRDISELLKPHDARLLPTAMHPWMEPGREMKLWPHEYNPVYETFDRIFNCKGHGWANLQSTHINLPFGNDDEFGRLHAATRLILPLLPALAASSPIVDGALTDDADHRLSVYMRNSARIPSVAGRIIPEPIFTRRAYERDLLGRIYSDLDPFDPKRILRYEWANARGCIARFDRGSIEIRLIDIQECPAADIAICELVRRTVGALVSEEWGPYAAQQRLDTEILRETLLRTTREVETATVDDADYLAALGIKAKQVPAGEIWQQLAQRLIPGNDPFRKPLDVILAEGTLSTRIRRALPPRPDLSRIREVYRSLADCLHEGRLFLP